MLTSTETESERQSHGMVDKNYCYRCSHLWASRKDDMPKMCPRCKSSRWDYSAIKDAACASCGERGHRSKSDGGCPKCRRPETDRMAGNTLRCNQCDHEWVKRADPMPKKCPVCRSFRWNEEKIPQLTCRRCGHMWRMRENKPRKCPKCQSEKWDVPSYKLQCRRCGYKWITGKASEDVEMCPSCKSRKWGKAPKLMICKSCGTLYVVKSESRGSRCPSCTSKRRAFKITCEFCGADWNSTMGEWTVCPRCGKPKSDDKDEKTIEIWSDGRFSLKYVYTGGFGYIYLWEEGQPISTIYLHDLLYKMNIATDQFITYLSDSANNEKWKVVSEDMFGHRNDYLKDVPFFMKRLNLCEFDATILSIHFAGMGPEAIAVKFDISIEEVRKSFDRTMAAYADNGIVVNDSSFTSDPMSHY